jgi:hypothetical protein
MIGLGALVGRNSRGVAACLLGLAVAVGRSAEASAARASNDLTYQVLLDRYVKVASSPGAPVETRVDYMPLVGFGGFNYDSLDSASSFAERLKQSVHEQLLAAVPSRLNEGARLAWAINAYNFLVIEQVANSAVHSDITSVGLPASVRDIKGFFETPVAKVEGANYSLDQFERRFVFGNGLGRPGARPVGPDPRAHFALVCAAKGCPPLLPRAYTADSLDLQLDYAVRNALRSPAHLRWNARDGTVEASAIFEWYARDFGGTRQAFAFLKRYAPERVRRVIEERHVKAISRTIPWDWRLNHSADEEPRHSKAR